MKKILIILVLSISLITNANETDPKEILVSKEWKLDIKKTIGLNSKNNERNKSFALKELVTDLNFTFAFTKDNTMVIKMHDFDVYKGIYYIKKLNGKNFLTQEIHSEKFIYEIISIQKEKIVFRPLNEQDNIILISLEKNDLEEILISNEWKMDSEYVKNFISKFEPSSEIEGLSDEEKKASISAMALTFEGVRYKFMKDSKFEMKVLVMEVERFKSIGTFSINKDKNEITINTEIDPNQIYKIISVAENKIHLQNLEGEKDLILVPSK